MILILALVALMSMAISPHAVAARSGQASQDHVLLGMHFLHARHDCNTKGGSRDVAPGFWDYVEFMPEDLRHMSYADFWHWWSEFERYKGDEKGLAEFDRIVDECIARGMKVKVDVAWSTWWTLDRDWTADSNTIFGAHDLDDWVHLCDLLARRYRGRIVLWMLQGEANSLEVYWQGAPIEHVSECYKLGYRAIKRVDPGMLVSIAGASPSVPREALDDWVRTHAAACKGLFDDIPMNYFGDAADPYHGMDEYRKSIRKILNDLGIRGVSIGSGESSFQWAETSATITRNPPTKITDDPAGMPYCELKQAWRCNESLGDFFDAGENKFVLWGTEYAPGLGWAWRWGFRKFQDWWGIWPDNYKIPGTNIVFGNDTEKEKLDLRPGWTSREADPFHPMWEVYKFWARMCPPGSEAVRISAEVKGIVSRVFKAAAYLQAEDRCVALFQNDVKTPITAELDLRRTDWPDGTALEVSTRNESIDYATGDVAVNLEKTTRAAKSRDVLSLKVPAVAGFTTVSVRRAKPALDAAYLDRVARDRVLVGKPVTCSVLVRNTGSSVWGKSTAKLCVYGSASRSWKLDRDVRPGETAAVAVTLRAPEAPGLESHSFRMRDAKGGWFGPMGIVSVHAEDPAAPRKLVAFREVGHTRLKWFAPEDAAAPDHYDLYRADGFEKPATVIARVKSTDYVDSKVENDRAYYYFVKAVDAKGRASRPSNEDNAKAISKPRIFDAEIVGHDVPARIRLGDPHTVTVTIRNTGSRAWDLSKPSEMRFFFNCTQQWGSQDEGLLPKIDLAGRPSVEPGDTITVAFPYVGQAEGRFENHWVLSVDPAGKARAYFGTPLLAETVVGNRE